MERALSSEQWRSDFLPRDDAVSFDKPTSACLLGTALLVALRDAVEGTLEDANKQAFLAEVKYIQSVVQHCINQRDAFSCSIPGLAPSLHQN